MPRRHAEQADTPRIALGAQSPPPSQQRLPHGSPSNEPSNPAGSGGLSPNAEVGSLVRDAPEVGGQAMIVVDEVEGDVWALNRVDDLGAFEWEAQS